MSGPKSTGAEGFGPFVAFQPSSFVSMPLRAGRGTTECRHCGQATPHHHTEAWIRENSLTLAADRLRAIQTSLAQNGCGQLYPSMARVYGLRGNEAFEMERRLERDLCAVLCEIGWRRDEDGSE